jgi:uncharacterized protein YceK
MRKLIVILLLAVLLLSGCTTSHKWTVYDLTCEAFSTQIVIDDNDPARKEYLYPSGEVAMIPCSYLPTGIVLDGNFK